MLRLIHLTDGPGFSAVDIQSAAEMLTSVEHGRRDGKDKRALALQISKEVRHTGLYHST